MYSVDRLLHNHKNLHNLGVIHIHSVPWFPQMVTWVLISCEPWHFGSFFLHVGRNTLCLFFPKKNLLFISKEPPRNPNQGGLGIVHPFLCWSFPLQGSLSKFFTSILRHLFYCFHEPKMYLLILLIICYHENPNLWGCNFIFFKKVNNKALFLKLQTHKVS